MTLERLLARDDGFDAASEQVSNLNRISFVHEDPSSANQFNAPKLRASEGEKGIGASPYDRTANFVPPIAMDLLGKPSKFKAVPESVDFVSPIAMDGFFP